MNLYYNLPWCHTSITSHGSSVYYRKTWQAPSTSAATPSHHLNLMVHAVAYHRKRSHTIVPYHRTIVPYHHTIAPYHRTIAPYHRTVPSHHRTVPSHRTIAPSQRTIAPSHRTIAPSHRTIAPYHCTIAPHHRTVAPSIVRTWLVSILSKRSYTYIELR